MNQCAPNSRNQPPKIAGGVGGANLGKRLPAAWVRRATVLYACAITALFFVRAYG